MQNILRSREKNKYVELVQTRNTVAVVIILCLILTLSLTLFTILYNTLYATPENWFMWPLWIFYAIAISIGFSKSIDMYKKYKSLHRELYPIPHDSTPVTPSSSSKNNEDDAFISNSN